MFHPTSEQTHGIFRIERFDGVSGFTDRGQSEMVKLFEGIWRQLYRGQPENSFQEIAPSFFHPDQIIYLVRVNDQPVGFFIRRHCEIEHYRVINSRIAGVVPAFQKHNLYHLIRDLDFAIEWEREPMRPRLLYYRTRNPILWFQMTRHCSRVALELETGRRDRHLIDLGAALARELYPEYAYEPEAMTCRNVYLSHGRPVFYKDLPHHENSMLDRLFYEHPAMRNTLDSPCFIGLLKPPSPRRAQPEAVGKCSRMIPERHRETHKLGNSGFLVQGNTPRQVVGERPYLRPIGETAI